MNRPSLTADQALNLAEGLAKQGKVTEAANIYRNILQQLPQHQRARAGLEALGLRTAGSSNSLQQDMAQLIQRYEAGRMDEARSMASTLLEKYPNQPLPLNILGVIYSREGKHAQAVRCFEDALDIAPDYVEVLGNLGSAYDKLGETEKAIECYNKSLIHQPEDPEVLYQLGRLQFEARNWQGAASNLEASIKLRPEFTPAYLQLGRALKNGRETQAAIETYQHLLKIDPASVEAHYQIGMIYLDRARYGQAAAWFRSGIKISPLHASSHCNLGRCLIEQGKREEAIEALNHARELNPDDPMVQHFSNAALGNTEGQAPQGYVASVFDDYADTFEFSLVDQLKYQTPTELHQMWLELTQNQAKVSRAVDLGCGTGLGAEAFKESCERITGIDLSEGMMDRARAKGLYDRLVQGEIAQVLNQLDEQFDLFICCDTFVYVGDMTPVMQAVARRSAPGACFVFSTEHLQSGTMELRPTGRYAHSEEYVTQTALASGFTVVGSRQARLRKEQGRWLTGGYYLLRSPG